MTNSLISFSIVTLMYLCIVRASKFRGMNSAIFLGIIGAIIYSVPAILNITLDFTAYVNGGDILKSGSTQAQSNYLIFWLSIALFSFLLPALKVRRLSLSATSSVKYSSLFLSYLGMVIFVVQSGNILFFLEPRDEQNYGLFYQLWRWFPVFAITYAFAAKGSLKIFYIIPIIIIFIMGDRTIIAIAFFAVIITKENIKLNALNIFGLVALIYLSSFGKIIYNAIKSFDLDILMLMFDFEIIKHVTSRFEPLGIYNHMNIVIAENIEADYGNFLLGVFGNLLVVPSYFGIDTNSFNTLINKSLSWTEFGVSGSYIAHWWVLFGEVGSFIGGAVYVMVLYSFDIMRNRASSLSYVALTIAAGLLAIYCHRNGIDNTISFFRQLFIVFVVLSFSRSVLTLKRYW